MEQYGKKFEHDPNFKGPLQKRSCTDVFCFLIFAVFVASWGFVGYYALANGDIEKLMNPTASEGRKCGIDSEVKNKPYLVFFNLNDCLSLTSCIVETVCHTDCPDENFLYNNPESPESLEYMKQKMICKLEVNLELVTSWNQMDSLVNDKKCARWYLKSKPVLNRCLPVDVWEEFENLTMNAEDLSKAKYVIQFFAEVQKVIKYSLEDIKENWKIILPLIVGSGVMAVLHIILLKCIALPFVYICILGICSLLSYGIFEMNRTYSSTGSSSSLVSLIACSIILAFVVLCTLFLRNRIYLACQLIKESSIAVTHILSSLIFPVFPWAAQLAVVVFSVTVALYLATIGTPNYQVEIQEDGKCLCPSSLGYVQGANCESTIFNEKCTENGGQCVSAGCHLVNLTTPWFLNYMQGVNIFGLFWIFFFISALGQMILAATFATWYWTFRKDKVPFFTLTVSVWRTFRYHLGTVAFGSLVIAICNILRLTLHWMSKKIKKYGNNQIAQGMVTCCKCFFWVLEKFLKYLNRNAYVMCAIHGKAFYQSAQDAFNLLVRNAVRVVVLDKIAEFLLFLGKLFITCLAAFVTWIFYGYYEIQPVRYWLVPMFLVSIGAYFITSVFFTVYSAAIDTLFLCFLEDCERNDGSEERPYYMSKRLRKLLHK